MKIREALNDARKGVVYPVYFLKGNDHFLQTFFIKKIATEFFKDNPIIKNFMHPDDMKGSEIIDRLTITDLFSSKQIFIIRNPQRIVGKAKLDLFDFCRKPIDNHILFLVNDDWKSKNNFFTKLELIIEPINVQTPFDQEMKKWAKYLIQKKNKNTHQKVVNMLVDMAGDSVKHLENEIEKISLNIGERSTIEIKDLEQFSGWKRDRQLWEFLLAFGKKDYYKTILLGKILISNYKTMIPLIYPLTTFFQEMLFLKMKSGTFKSYQGYIPIPPSVKKKLPYFTNGFQEKQIKVALYLLNNIDKRLKTQATTDETELIRFISNVLK